MKIKANIPVIITIVGPSGSGKTTMANIMSENGIPTIVSYTTRPMREEETNGKEHWFVTPEDKPQMSFRMLSRDNTISLFWIKYSSRSNSFLVSVISWSLIYASLRFISMDKSPIARRFSCLRFCRFRWAFTLASSSLGENGFVI